MRKIATVAAAAVMLLGGSMVGVASAMPSVHPGKVRPATWVVVECPTPIQRIEGIACVKWVP